MEDRHTSRCPNSVLIIAHDGMEVCDGAHWLFVMKKGDLEDVLGVGGGPEPIRLYSDASASPPRPGRLVATPSNPQG